MNDAGMTTTEVLDAIVRERERLMSAIDALGADSMVVVTEEGWMAKDVLAHLIHWAVQIAFGLGGDVEPPVYMMEERKRRELAGIDTGKMPTADETNALAVAHYRGASLNDVRAELERLMDLIVQQVGERSNDEMNATDAVPWARGRPLWHFVGGDTFMHWPLHAEAIERAASKQP